MVATLFLVICIHSFRDVERMELSGIFNVLRGAKNASAPSRKAGQEGDRTGVNSPSLRLNRYRIRLITRVAPRDGGRVLKLIGTAGAAGGGITCCQWLDRIARSAESTLPS